MKKLKKFLLYVIIGVALWIWSDILIYLNLNSVYDGISRRDYDVPQVSVSDARATLVNGYVIGTVKNTEEDNLNGKYLKVDLYSSMGNIIGTKYIEIAGLRDNQSMDFEVHFKLQDIESYDISVVDEAGIEIDDSFYDEEISKLTRIITLLAVKFTII